MTAPTGTALYVRRLSKKRHGTPKQFAKKCADYGLTWMALGGLWQQPRNGRVSTGMMNTPEVIHEYGDALWHQGLEVYVWGYPWIGAEEIFAEGMHKYGFNILLDPELGANPSKRSSGPAKQRANDHAKKLVRLLREVGTEQCGLSTFGNAWRMKWFPLLSFTRALLKHFPYRSFIGGQTYTDNSIIDRSVQDMHTVIKRVGAADGPTPKVRVVPNFGVYSWNTSNGKRAPGAKARSKTPDELRSHLYEFVDVLHPVQGLIGWEERFMNRKLWPVLAKFGDAMARGACVL